MTLPETDVAYHEGIGVYFAKEAYAGPPWRALILFIDTSVLIFVTIVFMVIGLLVSEAGAAGPLTVMCLWFLFCIFYLGPIHSIGCGTLGYRLTGFKLVDYRGLPPSWKRALIRICLFLYCPNHFIADPLLGLSPYAKQALWDKLSETMVVRRRAVIVGHGSIQCALEFTASICYLVREVSMDGRAVNPTKGRPSPN